MSRSASLAYFAFVLAGYAVVTVEGSSHDDEIVACVQFGMVAPTTTLDPIDHDECFGYCTMNYPLEVYIAVVVTGGTAGNCYCLDYSTAENAALCAGPCDNKCPDQPTQTCGSADHACSSLFKTTPKLNLIYTAATGTIVSRGYPDTTYLSYSQDTYTIRAPSRKPITLVIATMQIQTGDDYLRIYGDGVLVAALTGFTAPDPLLINAQEVKLELITNNLENFRGFSIDYSFPVECPSGCKDLCFETFEGHVCGCESGTLKTDMITCLACPEAGCEEVCSETSDGYMCSCSEGNSLNEDGKLCSGPVEPPTDPLKRCKKSFVYFLSHVKKCRSVSSRYPIWARKHRKL